MTKRIILITVSLLLTILSNQSISYASNLSLSQTHKLQQVNKFLDKNDVSNALKIVVPMLQQPTPNKLVFQYGCTALAQDNQTSKALTCWQQGFDLYPNNINIGLNLANIQLTQSNNKAALITLKSLLTLTKTNIQAKQQQNQIHYMLAYAHYQLGHYESVTQLLLSGQVMPHWWSLISYSQLALQQWSNAKQSAQKWLSIEPENPTAWQILTRSELGLGNRKSAVSSAYIGEILHQTDPALVTSSLSSNNYLFGNLKAYNFASQCVDKKLASFNQQALTCTQYAWLSGQYQKGLDYLQQFDLTQSAKVDDYYFLQGRLFAALHHNKNARNAWAKVGKGLLPEGSAVKIKLARQHRTNLQGQALMLIGQSYWLSKQWPEAMASYRKLSQTPGFESIAKAYGQRLTQLNSVK